MQLASTATPRSATSSLIFPGSVDELALLLLAVADHLGVFGISCAVLVFLPVLALRTTANSFGRDGAVWKVEKLAGKTGGSAAGTGLAIYMTLIGRSIHLNQESIGIPELKRLLVPARLRL
jgi:hypothetical protein